jgi:hypothetical protein
LAWRSGLLRLRLRLLWRFVVIRRRRRRMEERKEG